MYEMSTDWTQIQADLATAATRPGQPIWCNQTQTFRKIRAIPT